MLFLLFIIMLFLLFIISLFILLSRLKTFVAKIYHFGNETPSLIKTFLDSEQLFVPCLSRNWPELIEPI